MKIIAISDIHGHTARLEALAEVLAQADIVLLTGDVTNFGRRKEAERVIGDVQQYAKRLLAVPGNCDHDDVADFMVELGANIDGRAKVLDGLGFLGLGGSLPAPGGTPNELSEKEIEARLAAAVSGLEAHQPFILVSHQPPVNSVADRTSRGEHVGSKAVRAFIEARQPLACFTGHIHESRGQGSIGATQVINPGPLRQGHYAYAEADGELKSASIRQI